MALKASRSPYPFTQVAGLIAAFQGSCFFTATVGLFHLNGEYDKLPRPSGWAITGICCSIVSFLLGAIAVLTARYRDKTRLSFGMTLCWINGCSCGATIAATLLGFAPWSVSAALLWGWTAGAGGVQLKERWEDAKGKERQGPEYARVGS